MKNEHEKLIDEITAIELDMFLAVKNLGGTAACQEHPNAFKLMRKMSHCVQSKAFLESYLKDLQQAIRSGRNIMVEKYALMDRLIPDLTNDARIAVIAEKEAAWRDAAAAAYPHIVGRTNSEHFKNYLQGELQTLSPESLACYYDNVLNAEKEGRNLILERYAYLMVLLGYSSLDEREKQLAEKKNS